MNSEFINRLFRSGWLEEHYGGTGARNGFSVTVARAIAWRLIPRTARENAVGKLPADDGKQHKTGGAWRRTGVRVQRTERRTHRVHPIKSLVLNRCRAARDRIFGWSRENLRRAAQRALSREDRTLGSAGPGRRRKAPSSRSARPHGCLPPCPHTAPPSDARSAAAAPRAPPHGRGKGRRRHTGAPAGARRHAAVAAPARALP